LSEILNAEGSIALLMGNEAIARGAIESGANVVIGYPGTPSSEVIQSLSQVAEKVGMRVEWAVNEKVAFDVAAGAAIAGSRCLVTMKSAGLNVASDSVISVAYGDVNGGLVIYVGDDPAAHAGMEEQDSRFFAKISLLPMFDVHDPQSSKDAVVEAFEISEQFKLPVIVRSTTRTAHMRSEVSFGPVRTFNRSPSFKRDIRRQTRASPAWCTEQHTVLNQKIESMRPKIEGSGLNELHLTEKGGVGVMASGVSWNYIKEVIARHGLEGVSTLRIGSTNPLPDTLIRSLVDRVDRVLVLEELEPYIELHLRALIADMGRRVTVYGKHDGTLPRVGEYNYSLVEMALGRAMGVTLMGEDPELNAVRAEASKLAPPRPLPFCPGCPHRASYTAMKQALQELGYRAEDAIITGDIGCTILGMHPPFDLCSTEVSMGASIGMACGLRYAGLDNPIIAAIGDSTFFHAGIPPTINASWYNTGIVIAVLDNQITAMTGHQPSPSSGYTPTGEKSKQIVIEEILKASGIRSVRVVDPYDLKASKEAFVEALKSRETSAVVLRRACPLAARRMGPTPSRYSADAEKCTGCQICLRALTCPAMSVSPERKLVIDSEICAGCGVCAQICPAAAIAPRRA
jgi:indolepyruvate ferredoxin oxidoreductase alpha subunit